mgnify:CR=1 FL=1
MQVLRAPELFDLEPEWLMEIKNQVNGVGQQPQWLVNIEGNRFYSGLHPEADSVLDLMERLDLEGMSRAPEFALPVYLEGDSPWVKTVDRYCLLYTSPSPRD